MKKTIIICASLLAAAIAALIVIIINYYEWPEASGATYTGVLAIVTEDMTYEQFETYLSDSLSKEAQSEAERLFYEIQDAIKQDDAETLNNLELEFNSLNLFTRSSQSSLSYADSDFIEDDSQDEDSDGTETTSDAADAESLVAYAETMLDLGIPYVWGGKTTAGFDCSGFIYYCLNQIGYETEYMTSAAWANSSYETIDVMRKTEVGDILCFDGHVGICIGDGEMIECTSTVNGIRITEYKTSYYKSKWVCAKRIFD